VRCAPGAEPINRAVEAELRPLGCGERGQQGQLRIVDGGVELGELPLADRRDPHGVAASVALVGSARDAAGCLELAEHGVQVAAIDAEPPAQLGLTHRTTLGMLFKQFLQADAIDYLQLDSARLGSETRSLRSTSSPRSSACRYVPTQVASGCANSFSTSRSSTSSPCPGRSRIV
jgi:hypothetical protein